MRINILHPDSGWILSNIAQKTAAANDIFTALSVQDLKDSNLSDWSEVDAWIYCDIQNCFMPMMQEYYPQAIHVGLFTHLDKDSPKSYRPHWGSLDGVVHMAERYYNAFIANHFYPMDRMTVLRPGEVKDFPLKRVRLGVCQRGEHIGKGAEFLPEVFNNLPADVAEAVELCTIGNGWGDKDFGIPHVDWDSEDYADYPEFYRIIDYLLIPSLWEGGPMALLEAMASGIPIIAPDVGWVPEIMRELTGLLDLDGKDIDATINGVTYYRPSNFWLYRPGDVQALTHIIDSIVSVRLAKRRVVSGMSYERYGQGLQVFIDRLMRMRDEAS